MMTSAVPNHHQQYNMKYNNDQQVVVSTTHDFIIPDLSPPDGESSAPPPASDYVLECLQHWAVASTTTNDDENKRRGGGRRRHRMEICLVCHVGDDDDDEDDDEDEEDDDDGNEMIDHPRSGSCCCIDISSSSSSSNSNVNVNNSNSKNLQRRNSSTADEVIVTLPEPHLIMMTQLPCGHIYHTGCISKWLQRSCTCPTCRYELPTDDICFELGREERMKSFTTVATVVPPHPEVFQDTIRGEGGERGEGRYIDGDNNLWIPKDRCKQLILLQLDRNTSITPSKYWKAKKKTSTLYTLQHQ